jgi:hypothetical protein
LMVVAAWRIAVEVFGVRVQVSCDPPGLVDLIRSVLPPGSIEVPYRDADPGFVVTGGSDALFDVALGSHVMAVAADAAVAVRVLDAQIRARVATQAQRHVLVHAGAVAINGRGLVLPGRSFAGKSTLVAALVAAGAEYYSDELAVVDPNGMLRPYQRPITHRLSPAHAPAPPLVSTPPRVPGRGSAPTVMHAPPVAIGLVAITAFTPGASWQPVTRTVGEGVLALLANTPAAQADTRRILPLLSRAARDARVLEGPRGEAAETAHLLLDAITAG